MRLLPILSLLLLAPLLACTGAGGGPAIAFVLDETSVVVGPDGTASLGLTLYRLGGYEGEIRVGVSGTPPGVTVPVLTLPPGETAGPIAFQASIAPSPGRYVVTVEAVGDGVSTARTTVRLRVLGPPGQLDPGFGSAGSTVTSIVTPEGRTVGGRAEGMVVLPDDRIVVVGTARIPEGAGPGGTIYSTEVCLVRYTRDGALDTTFGDGGRVFTRIETVGAPTIPAQAHGRDVIRTRTGELVVTGPAVPGADTDQLVARYLADGSLDPSFGSGGIVLTDFGTGRDNHGNAVAEDADGRYVVVGWQGDGLLTSIMSITRYRRDGTLDTSFGGGGTGFRLHVFAGVRCEATEVAILPDGSLVVVGWADPGSGRALAVLGLLGDGTLDRSFGIDGEFLFDWDAEHEGRAVSAADGSPLVAGHVDHQGLLLGLKENGFEDADWLLGGVNRTEIAGKEIRLEDLLETPSRPYGAGTLRTPRDPTAAPGPDDHEALVTGHHPEGLLDIAFGDAGFARVRYLLTLPSTGVGIGRQSDGTLILAGTANPEFGQFGVARLWP